LMEGAEETVRERMNMVRLASTTAAASTSIPIIASR
jgi:hypothetical protein